MQDKFLSETYGRFDHSDQKQHLQDLVNGKKEITIDDIPPEILDKLLLIWELFKE